MNFLKKNVVKTTVVAMAIAVAAFGYSQSNETNALSNVQSAIGAFTKVTPANAGGECCVPSLGSTCTVYVNGVPYISNNMKNGFCN